MRSLSFDRKKELPPPMLREIEQNRWPVAGPKAYPVLISVDAQMQPLPTTERDVRVMTACTHAFLDFFAQYRSVYTGDAVFPGPINAPVISSFTVNDDVTVTLTASYDVVASVVEDDLIEDGQPALVLCPVN
jgi:hypothetical protein